jgi:hypothetical protein
MKYKLEINYRDEVEAENEEEALLNFMKSIEEKEPFHIWIEEHMTITRKKDNEIPLSIEVPLWFTNDEEEIVVDRQEMVDTLEREIGELEDRLNGKGGIK